MTKKKKQHQHRHEPHTIPEDDDGYTLTKFVVDHPGLYPTLRFQYRPIAAVPRARFVDRRQAEPSEEKLTANMSAVLAKQIVSWDAVDHKGQQLPRTKDAVQTLHPVLLNRLFNIVIWSTDGGDVDPEAKPEKPVIDDWTSDLPTSPSNDAADVEDRQGN